MKGNAWEPPAFLGFVLILMGGLPVGGVAQELDASKCPNAMVGMQSSIWRITEIPVCWEVWKPEEANDRNMVQEAVKNTWEKQSSIRFSGWQQCRSDARGIRIGVADIGPHVRGVGTQIDGMKNGMFLNFLFDVWGGDFCKTPGKRDHCIRMTAIHEFGHALGFTHEQNRTDAPAWCREQSQGTVGDIMITPYDRESVMNYCNDLYGSSELSALDIQGLQSWYGKPGQPANRYDGEWQTTLRYSDPGCVNDQIRVTVRGREVTGLVKAPWGKEVAVTGRLDEESRLQGIDFNFSEVDRVQMRGRFPDGMVQSTDCGCGQYRFSRIE